MVKERFFLYRGHAGRTMDDLRNRLQQPTLQRNECDHIWTRNSTLFMVLSDLPGAKLTRSGCNILIEYWGHCWAFSEEKTILGKWDGTEVSTIPLSEPYNEGDLLTYL